MSILRLQSVPGDEEIQEKLLTVSGYSPRMPHKEAAQCACDILLPLDEPAWAFAYLTSKDAEGRYISNCALLSGYYVQRSVFGMLTRNNSNPYRGQISEIFTDVIQNAQAFGAWSTSRENLLQPPQCGDIVHIGDGKRSHMSNVYAYEGDRYSGRALCVDGGQGDNTWVLERERTWTVKNGIPMLGDRIIRGIQRVAMLRANCLEAADTDVPPPPSGRPTEDMSR